MRRMAVLAALALLAGCGDSEDFAMDVALTPDRVKSQLARIDGGMVVRGLSLTPVAVDSGTRRELTFVMKGDAGEGRLHFRFEDVAANATRMHVELTLPATEMKIDGADKVLSETKAERALEEALKAWAESQTRSGYASLDPLNEIVGGMVLALTPAKMTEVFAAQGDEARLRGMIDPSVLSELEEDEGGEAELAGGNAGAPVTDTKARTEEAARPMNLAEGVDPAGLDPKGVDPSASQ